MIDVNELQDRFDNDSDTVEELEELIDDIKDTRDLIEDEHDEAVDEYNEMLDDSYGSVSVAGYDYDTSHLLFKVDYIAWREGYLDYFNEKSNELYNLLNDAEEKLKELEEEEKPKKRKR